MKTTFKVEDNEFVMYLEGRLDTAASSQAEKDLRALYDCEGHDVVLDCTDLEYISSSGLRLFLNVLKNAHAKGSSVFIKGIGGTAAFAFKGDVFAHHLSFFITVRAFVEYTVKAIRTEGLVNLYMVFLLPLKLVKGKITLYDLIDLCG